MPSRKTLSFHTGTCGCNKASLEHIVSSKGTGNAACLVVGGAPEALNAHPGTYNLKLASRKGFIKSALKTGLVPYKLFFCAFIMNN